MTDAAPAASLSPRAALGHRDFVLYLLVRFSSTVSMLMVGVAVGWQIYDLTKDPLHLGYVGLAQFLPQFLLTLWAGHVADLVDRRRILLVTLAAEAVCAGALVALSLQGTPSVWAIYALLVAFGAARAFAGPASQSLVPLLVPREIFPNAVAWSSGVWQVAVIGGPALGGVVYVLGAPAVYGLAAGLLGLGAVAVAGMKTRLHPPAQTDEPMMDRLFAGIRFLKSRPKLMGAISLDLFAVLSGGATALLPVYAADILHVGPVGLGVLRSAPAVGAALMALWVAHHPLTRKAGKVMLGSVALFGFATVIFGLSENFWLSLAALAVLGGADMVSVIVRHTLVQLETPDAMRGRVTAVNLVFIGASNELGEFESGITAAWWGTVPAVVIGGLGTMLVVGFWAWKFPQLRKLDRLDEGK